MANSTMTLDLISSSQANKEVTANSLFDSMSPAALYGRRASTTAALTFGYYGGTVMIGDTPTQIANGTVTLTASATNYVEADPATGTVSANTTGFTAGHTPLYQVVTGPATATSYTDLRVLGGGSGSGTVKSINTKTPDSSGAVTLTASDVGADAAGAAIAAISAHDAASDPHPQYLTPAEGDARYASSTAATGVSSVNGHTGTVTLTASDVSAVATTALGAASGVAQLGSDQKLLPAQLPDLGIVDFLGTVASQSAVLALTGQKGDWAIRSDDGKVYVITGSTPSNIGSWTAMSYPAAAIPVFGASGSSHSSGIVPDPGATAGTTRFLREDGGWAVPPGAGGAAVYVSDTAPSSPSTNQLWWRSDIGQLFIYYSDGTSSQWVQASPGVPGPKGDTGNAGAAGPTGAAGGLFGGQLNAAPAVASWAQRNIASPATAVDSSAGVCITDQFGAGPRIRALTIAAPTAPYTIDALLAADFPWANYAGAGLCFSDGTRYQTLMAGYTTTVPAGPNIRIVNFSSASAYASDATSQQAWFFHPGLIWMRIQDDGTNISFYRSADGVNWNLRYSVSKSSGYLGASGYTNIGFFLDVEGTAQSGTTQNCSVTLLSWKQH